jgi:hypothetical protein
LIWWRFCSPARARRIWGKKEPLTAAGLHGLRDEFTRTIAPTRALAAETLIVERTLSDLVNQACGLTSAEIKLMWQTAPPRPACPSLHPQLILRVWRVEPLRCPVWQNPLEVIPMVDDPWVLGLRESPQNWPRIPS